MANFKQRLTGGHPNSLGCTIEVVEEVLQDNSLFQELFECYFSEDEVVRLRTSNAMKRIGKSKKALLVPYIDRFQSEIAKINQASTQWTLSQLFATLENEMSEPQIERAKTIMKSNLETHDDWIVLNTTMDTLGKWSGKDEQLKDWLLPKLEIIKNDKRKSVSAKANKLLKQLK